MKTCTTCKSEKPFSEFYQGSAKCKPCACGAAMERRARLLNDPAWVEKERERCRLKQERRRAAGIKDRPSAEVRRRWLEKNKHKRKAHHAINNRIRDGKMLRGSACSDCGASGVELEAHHPDYNQPLLIQWLCTKCHGKTRRKAA